MNPQPSTSDSQSLVFKTGGMIMLAGTWLALIGLTLTAGLIGMAVLIPADEIPFWLRVGLMVLAAIPLAFAALGVWLTFGGQRVTLDAAARQVCIDYGRWWTWKREIRSFDEFEAVELHRRATIVGVDRGGAGRPTYPVRLLSGGDEVELADAGSERKARAIAERVANHTGLPLHVEMDGEMTVREAGRLDESLAERARRLGDDVRWPKLPADSRIAVQTLGEETILKLPRPNRKLFLEGVLGVVFLVLVYGWALGAAAYFLVGWLAGFGIDPTTSAWPVLVWALPIIPIVYILGFGMILLVGRERIVISPRVFKRVWRFPVGSWTRRIPAGKIEELVDNKDDVILRTDRASCRLGFALDKKERRWLRKAIRHLLVKGMR